MLKKLTSILQSLRARKSYERLVSKLERINADEIRTIEQGGFPGRAQQVLGGNRR